MSFACLNRATRALALGVLGLVAITAVAQGDARERIRIPLGRSEVVLSQEIVRTIAISEPKIADAAVGSERTIIVNGKGLGTATLVVYADGGRYTAYDIEVYEPNSDKQVALHVRVAEANENASRELGFDVLGTGLINNGKDGTLTGGLFPTKVNEPHDPPGLGPSTDGFLSYTRPSGFAVQTVWKALEEKGDLRTLANPTLVARSGDKASFLAGGEFPVPVASSGSTTGGSATVTVEWKQFGVKVDFLPTVQDDGSIVLQVMPEVSQLNFAQGVEINGFRIPSLVTRRTDTTVRLEPGQNLVIGGLKQTENTKTVRRIPLIGSVPLLGFFFSHTTVEKVQRELVLVVSPEMIVGDRKMPALPGTESKN